MRASTRGYGCNTVWGFSTHCWSAKKNGNTYEKKTWKTTKPCFSGTKNKNTSQVVRNYNLMVLFQTWQSDYDHGWGQIKEWYTVKKNQSTATNSVQISSELKWPDSSSVYTTQLKDSNPIPSIHHYDSSWTIRCHHRLQIPTLPRPHPQINNLEIKWKQESSHLKYNSSLSQIFHLQIIMNHNESLDVMSVIIKNSSKIPKSPYHCHLNH